MNRNNFFELILQQSCHLSLYTIRLFGWLYDAFPKNFPRLLKQVWSLGFLCSTLQRFCSVFLFDVLKWNSPFARFTEYRIYNHCNWFVLWWQTPGSQNMQIHDFFWQDGDVCLIEEPLSCQRVKTLEILFEFFVKILNSLPNGLLMNR